MRLYYLIFTLLIGSTALAQQTRYIDEVFPEVTVISDQLFSVNISVATGEPAADTMYADFYLPAGDTVSARPVALVMHTGTFLPRGFAAPTGAKDDYANIQIARRLAQRGYVAISFDYRIGWNPLAPSDVERRNQLINAAYRSIQDMYALIRFMNMTVTDQGNPFAVDMSKVAIFGIGTGGFISHNAAVLDRPNEEIYIPKFTDPISLEPMIDTLLVGNITGETQGLINIPNHVGYPNDFHFAFGLDAGIGDSTWLDIGEPRMPLVCVGVANHPTTPFGIDPITGEINCDLPVFTGAGTGIFVVNIAGSACIIQKANELGYNDRLKAFDWNDPISETLREQEFAQEHLWAIGLEGFQAGPWEYWDSVFWKEIDSPLPQFDNVHEAGLATNPDMSMEKANAYIDTALWFFAPRSCAALELGCDVTSGLVDLEETDYEFKIAPNPAVDEVNISIDGSNDMRAIWVFDMFGRVVYYRDGLREAVHSVRVNDLTPGVYGIKAQVGDKGFVSGKLMIQR